MTQIIQNDDKIVVWFSCGAASAVALKRTIDRFGRDRVSAVNTMVIEEHPDNRRFFDDVADWCGVTIEQAQSPGVTVPSAKHIWNETSYMSNPWGAPCTKILKKGARYEWQRKFNPDWHVLGFTADEEKRHRRFVMSETENVIPVLLEYGITKDDCYKIITEAGIKLPEMYHLGYPNANCIGCVKASSPTYWNLVRKTHPDVFKDRAEQSRRLGARLVRVAGKRLFLDELDPNAKGKALKSMPDCGIFCEEKADDDGL